MSNNQRELIGHLEREGVLHSLSVRKALTAVDRADFVPDDLRYLAYEDIALPIGEGQTISQPYTVAFMLERLAAEKGNKILEVGYGSGWQTALLAHIVGEKSLLYGFERIPALCDLGRRNLQKYPDLLRRTVLMCISAESGCSEAAPFDRIICAAEVSEVPAAWREQLKNGGRMVYPSRGSILVEIKLEDGGFKAEEHHGFVFVPFI